MHCVQRLLCLAAIAALPSLAAAAGPNGVLHWDAEALRKALGVTAPEVKEYFTDGRRISFLIERRFAHEVLQGRMAPTEGTPYDVIDAHGGKWEVRSLTDRGVYFCPSHMVGSSRHFDVAGFMAKMDGIEGYLVSDIEQFPSVPYWVVRTDTVRAWWRDHKLGATTKVSYEEARRLFAAMPMQALPARP